MFSQITTTKTSASTYTATATREMFALGHHATDFTLSSKSNVFIHLPVWSSQNLTVLSSEPTERWWWISHA